MAENRARIETEIMPKYQVNVALVLEADSAQEAEHIVKERARLKWPPVESVSVEVVVEEDLLADIVFTPAAELIARVVEGE